VFREYLWTKTDGGRRGRAARRWAARLRGGPVTLPQELDLTDVTRAEVVIEKFAVRWYARLAISINNKAWIDGPEAAGIPQTALDYQQHLFPSCRCARPVAGRRRQPIPAEGQHEHPWNWPQHLIYGVHVRIF